MNKSPENSYVNNKNDTLKEFNNLPNASLLKQNIWNFNENIFREQEKTNKNLESISQETRMKLLGWSLLTSNDNLMPWNNKDDGRTFGVHWGLQVQRGGIL